MIPQCVLRVKKCMRMSDTMVGAGGANLQHECSVIHLSIYVNLGAKVSEY